MATINLQNHGISTALKSDGLSFAKNFNGSSKYIYDLISSPQRLPVRKFVYPIVFKSMKIVKQSHGPPVSANSPILHMSPSKVKIKVVGTMPSDIDRGLISKATEVGVAVFILKDNNKVLFGRRLSTPIVSYTYALPGGHLELGESFEECAIREVKEETGLDINDVRLVTRTINLLPDEVSLHVIYMSAHLSSTDQTPQNNEPDKCQGWDWYDLQNLPEPMFGPLNAMLQDGFNPFPIDS